ncbi:DNA translocase stage III sporulation protein [Fictibacillus macauensis ZFHKF-1]|uniref:DNA translocase stage III sporulation protein n=1 Tax=Fictibacillus macauensis ZFHKF-1 TaxID=1196324 RepID=I8AIF7_9BACL|nr:DNA translocase FtsK [Fictibacillus macauensis]EIT85492.1 DNA translocase stage III sporulation protein [Fictibacillus macauensis ZFHKF-1]
MSWLKKLMNLMFVEEPSEDEEEVHTPRKETEKSQTKRSVGRFQSSQHSASAKMVSRYPEGNFRFPLIGDDEHIGHESERRSTASQERALTVENETISKPEPKVEKRPFQPSQIPSPVYGFSKRQELRSQQETPMPHENRQTQPVQDSSTRSLYESRPKSHFKPSEVPSPIYGYRDRSPDTILNPGLWKASELQKKAPMPPVAEPTVLLPNDETRSAPLLELTDTEQQESLVLPDVSSDDVIIAREVPQSLEEEQDRPKLMLIEHEEEDVVSVDPPSVQAPETVAERVTEVPPLEEPPAPKLQQQQPKRGGTYVPFNVLMLKNDRKRESKKQGVVTEMRSPEPEPVTEAPPVINAPVTESRAPLTTPESSWDDPSFPTLSFLHAPPIETEDDSVWMEEQRDLLQMTLDNFNVNAEVVNMTKGPSVTRLEVHPAPGVKVNKITNLSDDIKLSLSAKDIRIEAPIPGKNTIGIEVPNRFSQAVYLREILESPEFQQSDSPLTVALGLDLSGQPVVTDLQKMPHGLIAGATGSGKSVCINSILVSLMYKASPEEVRLLLVDPKMVELAPYNQIPHLVTPVITDPKEATSALKWTVEEMERRYERFAATAVRDIKRYNQKMKEERHDDQKMPYIVVVIDELADLMMVSPGDVEEAICRIAQKARACGIHLLLATQRPSVDVITGLIKANIPTRAAFAVSSAVDSRTILDMSGAERLLGRGDMLFMENGSSKAVRIQGNFVSDEEIERVTTFVKEQYPTSYLFTKEELSYSSQAFDPEDDLFEEACYYVLDVGAASSSSIQRRFRVGFNRAARLVEMMEACGLVSEAMGSKPRSVLLTAEEFENKMYHEQEA